jgi:hypothetical protein
MSGTEAGKGRVVAVVTVALTMLVAVPLIAQAACGGIQRGHAQKQVNPEGRPPFAIGDSSMLLSIPPLTKEGYNVNARGCRQWPEGMAVISNHLHKHRLPHLVVVALGADGTISSSQIDQLFHFLPKRKVVGLVTPRELGGGSGSDAENIRDARKKHGKRLVVLDWVKYSEGHSSWFQPDGLHLTFEGAKAFARFLKKALPFAKSGKFPHGAVFPT